MLRCVKPDCTLLAGKADALSGGSTKTSRGQFALCLFALREPNYLAAGLVASTGLVLSAAGLAASTGLAAGAFLLLFLLDFLAGLAGASGALVASVLAVASAA